MGRREIPWVQAAWPALLLFALAIAAEVFPVAFGGPIRDLLPGLAAAALLAPLMLGIVFTRAIWIRGLLSLVCAAIAVSFFWPWPWAGDSVAIYFLAIIYGFFAALAVLFVVIRWRTPVDQQPMAGGPKT